MLMDSVDRLKAHLSCTQSIVHGGIVVTLFSLNDGVVGGARHCSVWIDA